jgi:hypothetical protein
MNKEWAQKERLQMNFWPCTCATLDDPDIPPRQEPQLGIFQIRMQSLTKGCCFI